MTKNIDSWDENMVKYTNLKESDLKSCASEMFMLLHNSQYSSLKAVKEKFADKKYGEVSLIQISSSSSKHLLSVNKMNTNNKNYASTSKTQSTLATESKSRGTGDKMQGLAKTSSFHSGSNGKI
eukprot:CAMPEP_0116871524 /NCGR_PEP_ID=MMETSP0463-20121206/1898_1 /TAXON_ID=181622 /ORGANISM="Strombidinopsis sp, Strain SopsisLIS2011" /LENGTH=123 /DNA_ID=CAMNT_0004510079 /DNA_START=1665 /DNA_END=2036 /DNA_ORIENTATION=+